MDVGQRRVGFLISSRVEGWIGALLNQFLDAGAQLVSQRFLVFSKKTAEFRPFPVPLNFRDAQTKFHRRERDSRRVPPGKVTDLVFIDSEEDEGHVQLKASTQMLATVGLQNSSWPHRPGSLEFWSPIVDGCNVFELNMPSVWTPAVDVILDGLGLEMKSHV